MRRRLPWVATLAFMAGCEGSGSDIGPRIPRLPEASYKVLVLDDQGRGAVAARITVEGSSVVAATGRSGRADLRASPSGFRRLTVDAANASATDSDRLETLVFAAGTPDGGELPYAVHVPDSSGSAELTLSTGLQATPAVLDDSASSGGIVTVPAGSTVGFGAASTVTLRTGPLGAGHLPGDLPVAGMGGRLFGAGVFLGPPSATFSPPADLSMPNDLQLPAASTAELHHLDPATGTWVQVGSGTVDGTGARIDASGVLALGGLYAFAAVVPSTATVTGVVRDEQGRGVSGALVRAGEVRGRSDGSGRFTLGGVAADLGDGSPRTVTVEIRGGRLWFPVGTTTSAGLTPGSVVDLGDVTLATFTVSNLRMQQITRGRQDAFRRMGVSSSENLIGYLGIGDEDGIIAFEEVPTRFSGFLQGRPRDDVFVFRTQSLFFMEDGRLNLDLQVFNDEIPWFGGGRNSRMVAVDRVGGGGIEGAAFVQGSQPNAGFIDISRENGTVIADRSLAGRGTASLTTSSDGLTVTSALTFVDPNAQLLDFELDRALRAPLGAFDRHGLVTGDLTMANPAAEHRLTATRRLNLSDWYDHVFEGRDVTGDLPAKVDPEITGGTTFRVGVAAPAGNLAGVEGMTAGGIFTLARLGFLAGLRPVEGGEITRDLPLSEVASASFTAPGALTGLDPALTVADLAFDLALRLSDGQVVEIAEDVGGNHLASGSDAVFSLPPLSGSLAGTRWLLGFGGATAVGGSTIDQRSVLVLDAGPAPTVTLHPVPDILQPAPGAMVSSTGFTVQYTVPPGTTYLVLELRSQSPGEVLGWRVVLPPTVSQFDFVELPMPATTPLQAGRTYTLELTAARVETGTLARFADFYARLAGHWRAVTAAGREVNAFSSRSITVTAN